jgi:F420-non-reducing hydrogenase iron-sulfur subunit
MADNEPLIIAFCCHYCAYAAADLAGSMRLQYPTNVRVLKLPCTGKMEVNYLLTAFEKGVDGVIVAGCLEGGCHYFEGNLRARRRVERAREILEEIGLEPERVEMFNLSSAEGPRFAQIVTEMSARLAKLGPSPLRPERASLEEGVQEMTRQAEADVARETHECATEG